MKVAIVVVLAAACGGTAATAVKAPKAQPDIDPAQATQDAKGLVGEVTMSIGNGDTDGLMTLLSDHLVVFGPRKADALGNRTDALVALGKVVDRKNKRPLKLDEKAMVPAPGGRSAWVFDTIDLGGETLAVTAMLTNADDIWLVDTVSIGEPQPIGTLRKAAATDALVPPALGPAKVDGAAKAIVDKFQKGLVDQESWGDDLAQSDEAVVAGPIQGELARGKDEIKKLWAKRIKDGTREIAVGEPSAGMMPDGHLAWVSAPLTRVSETGESLPLRAFAVYEQHGADWRMVALQESIAIDAPGSGVAFHRAPPPPPPPPVEDAPKPKVAAADKPKKAKKKPADDADEAPKPKTKKVTAKPKQPADDDADETPKRKAVKKKKPAADDDDDKPKLKKKKPAADDDDDEKPKMKKKKPAADDDDEKPKLKKKKPASDDDADETPKTKKKKPAADDDDDRPKLKKKKPASDDDADEAPKTKKKKPAADDDDDDKPKLKKKKPVVDDSDDDDKPKTKKKKKKPADDDVEVTDD